MRIVARSFLRHLTRRRSLSILQLLGIACGVAAVMGMTLSAKAALTSFSQAVEFLRGKSTHLMERPAGPMDEAVLTDVMHDPAVDAFSPVIDRRILLKNGDSVRLLGIDPFLDRTLRPDLYRFPPEESGDDAERYRSFLFDERTVFVEAGLAGVLGTGPGKTLETSKGSLSVAGIFPNPSGEPLLLMDIAHTQTLFGLQGKIDRVDLIVNDEQAFRSRWEKGYLIQSNKQRKETLGAMLGAFRLNLEALSLLALFVGVFLIYNTAMFTVVSRTKEVGILRSLGARQREIVVAFLSQILLFGLMGGILGGAAGYFLSCFLTSVIGNTISSLYFFLRPSPLPWSWWIPAIGGLFGCCVSLLGSFFPLAELARVDPVSTLRGRTPQRGNRKKAWKAAVFGAASVAAGCILLYLSHVDVYVGFAGTFGILFGCSLFAGITLLALGPSIRFALRGVGGLPGKIAAGNIRQNLGRTGVAVAAFMVALSMSIGLSAMIGSFRESLKWWMDSQLTGDLYISTVSEIPVPESFYEELKTIPGIGGIDPYRNVQIIYRDKPVTVASIDASVLKRYTKFGWLSGGNENWDPVERGAVIISESFSRNFGANRGGTITLQGADGPVDLPVQAVFYDYTTEHGLIMMDRSTYLRIYGDHSISSLAVFLDPGSLAGREVIDAVKARARALGLPVFTRAQLHDNILGVFDKTFAVTRSMRIMAIIIAFFGIAGALMTLFIERSREFGIYRSLGFSTSQVAVMTLLEALGMGSVSFILSTVTGTALAVILIRVINLQSFNWTIFYYPAWQPYVMAGAVALAASVAAALYPIWKVCRTYPQMQIREE